MVRLSSRSTIHDQRRIPMPDPDWTKLFGPIDASPHSGSAEPKVPAPPAPAPPIASAPSAAPREISPGVFDMAASFAGSMAQFAASGFKTVSDEVYQARLAQCS